MEKFKKNAKYCHRTINPPLFNEDDTTCVIDKCIVPELHILQGFVNHVFWDGLVHLVGRKEVLIWPKDLKLVPENYQGDVFEGNACREFLKQADKLNNPKIHKNVHNLSIVPFINVFKAMDKVVECCFSLKGVGPNSHSLVHN